MNKPNILHMKQWKLNKVTLIKMHVEDKVEHITSF